MSNQLATASVHPGHLEAASAHARADSGGKLGTRGAPAVAAGFARFRVTVPALLGLAVGPTGDQAERASAGAWAHDSTPTGVSESEGQGRVAVWTPGPTRNSSPGCPLALSS